MTRSRRYLIRAGVLMGLAPLLVYVGPRSFLAHDEGYYALQARWIQLSGQWLAPLWWDQPLYDRTIGVQWLIAGSEQLLGSGAWAAHLPSILAACASLVFTAQLGRQLLGFGMGWLSALLLALTPLWLNYAHQASQDMPLLALELLGLLALLRCTPGKADPWPWLAGLWLGPAVLMKGFMVAVPVVAMLPLALMRRRHLLVDGRFWAGLALGAMPVALWLHLSIEQFGPGVVGGLVDKLLYLSKSDTYSEGPFYYFWNIPANAAPWSLAALVGLAVGWRHWRGEQQLVLVTYPCTLLLLLSVFRTKTPYYGLQLTPFLALWAAFALKEWVASGPCRPRWPAWAAAVIGGVLLIAGSLVLRPSLGLENTLAPLPSATVAVAAWSVGTSWLLLPQQHRSSRAFMAVLLGPWLAMVLLVQSGLFTDRSPLQRRALESAALQGALSQGPVAVVAPAPLDGDAHSQLILVALGTPHLGPMLRSLNDVPPGRWAWIQEQELSRIQSSEPITTLAKGSDLAPWTLVRRGHRFSDEQRVSP